MKRILFLITLSLVVLIKSDDFALADAYETTFKGTLTLTDKEGKTTTHEIHHKGTLKNKK